MLLGKVAYPVRALRGRGCNHPCPQPALGVRRDFAESGASYTTRRINTTILVAYCELTIRRSGLRMGESGGVTICPNTYPTL